MLKSQKAWDSRREEGKTKHKIKKREREPEDTD